MLRIHSKNVFRLFFSLPTRSFKISTVDFLPGLSHRSLLTTQRTPTSQKSLRLASHGLSKDKGLLSRNFHATRRNEAFPIFLVALKSSFVINMMQTVIRIALTLVPFALVRKHIWQKWLRKLDRNPNMFPPEWHAKRPGLIRGIRINGIIVKFLLMVPVGLFSLVVFASLERTPLTGRWRLIVLSPDEEESIAHDLAGPGWYKAVNELLTTSNGPPKYIPPTDWRHVWVERTLRRLESVVPSLQDEKFLHESWLQRDEKDPPFPPPPTYPLIPRPRASQRLHYLEPPNTETEHSNHHFKTDGPPHSVLGPPYSVLVTDEPGQSNAFSYGFGPNGSGGVVIFSGFLDDILRNTKPPETLTEPSSLFSFLSRVFFPSPSSAAPVPSPEQDAQLAILVAHELAHLLLSHHLETLSSASIFVPSLTSFVTDLFRALLFPITMVGGPFLNDALKQVGDVGKREFTTACDSCSSHKMEIEADVVSIRLLALAGWDARAAVDFWESRIHTPPPQEVRQQAVQSKLNGRVPGSHWVSQDGGVQSSSHPVDRLRVQKLKEELERWEVERKRALRNQVSQS